ncbi:hypothetical protein E2562_032239 [Oryza meyeriana var. granulata]|uniref:Uncharacterized protein n=1 Tax=Oryza meyeriana var. granulata TaxID=110450 RepID=A0A6G1D9U0_9ORYZ|nr:hypothetical protein E2562_032239 [Oryza meyeriana var. granulata]
MNRTSHSMRVVSCNANLRGLMYTEESYSYRFQTSLFWQETIIQFAAMAARWATCIVELHCGMERLSQNMPKGGTLSSLVLSILLARTFARAGTAPC